MTLRDSTTRIAATCWPPPPAGPLSRPPGTRGPAPPASMSGLAETVEAGGGSAKGARCAAQGPEAAGRTELYEPPPCMPHGGAPGDQGQPPLERRFWPPPRRGRGRLALGGLMPWLLTLPGRPSPPASVGDAIQPAGSILAGQAAQARATNAPAALPSLLPTHWKALSGWQPMAPRCPRCTCWCRCSGSPLRRRRRRLPPATHQPCC